MLSGCSSSGAKRTFESAAGLTEGIEKPIQQTLHDFKGTKEHVFMILRLIVILVTRYVQITKGIG